MAQHNYGFKVTTLQGNMALYAAGLPIYNNPKDPFTKPKPKVRAGQGVFFDLETGLSLAPADLATRNYVGIGVGVGPMIGGPADFMQLTAFDMFDLCGVEYINSQAPVCAQAPSGRLLMECVDCNQDIAVKVRYRNNTTQQYKGENVWDEFTMYANKACDQCNNCTDPGDVCSAVTCLLEASLKPTINLKMPSNIFMPKYPANIPFFVNKIQTGQLLYPFCLGPLSTTCAECVQLDAIIGINIGGTNYFFTDTTTVNDPTKTWISQLDYIVEQINDQFKTLGIAGSATYIHGGDNNCCQKKLTILSCQAVTLIGGTQLVPTVIATCSPAVDPFAAVSIPEQCLTCVPGAPAPKVYSCGLNIQFDLEQYLCSCNPDVPGMEYFGIEYQIEVIGMKPGTWRWIEDTPSVLPNNNGYQWMLKNLAQENGGIGRNYDNYTLVRGWFGQPIGSSKVANLSVFSNCRESYCSWTMGLRPLQSNGTAAGDKYGPRWEQHFLMASKDTVTIASWMPYLVQIASRSNCPYKTAPLCIDALTGAAIESNVVNDGTSINGRLNGQ